MQKIKRILNENLFYWKSLNLLICGDKISATELLGW
jgi:hypothetical protein